MTVLTPAGEDTREDTGQPPTERERYIALLGSVTDLLREHPEIPQPSIYGDIVQFCVFSEDAPQGVATIRRAIGGTWDKGPAEDEAYFRFTGKWHGFPVIASVYRHAVCTRRVVGMEDRPVEKVVTPAVTETVMEPTEIIEWICEPLLAPRPAVADEAPKAVV
jgi:hypothetical protein